MQITYQYKLRPTAEQEALMSAWLDKLRAQYNWLLVKPWQQVKVRSPHTKQLYLELMQRYWALLARIHFPVSSYRRRMKSLSLG